jgi:hypothetical protein
MTVTTVTILEVTYNNNTYIISINIAVSSTQTVSIIYTVEV